MDYTITRPEACTEELRLAVEELTGQLRGCPQTIGGDLLARILADPASRLYVLRDGSGAIAGMLTLGLYSSPTGVKAWIEDVAVDAVHRGKGYGRTLVEYAVQEAREAGANTLSLTSRSERVAANELYRSMGFEVQQTNFYKMRF